MYVLIDQNYWNLADKKESLIDILTDCHRYSSARKKRDSKYEQPRRPIEAEEKTPAATDKEDSKHECPKRPAPQIKKARPAYRDKRHGARNKKARICEENTRGPRKGTYGSEHQEWLGAKHQTVFYMASFFQMTFFSK